MAFANVTDIESRWRELTDEEAARANALLEDASNILGALVEVDPDDREQEASLRQVCANMVIRAMGSPSDMFGASSATITAGAYSQTVNYSAPSGDLYLTKMEKRLLGITSGYIGSIRAMTWSDHD